MGGDGGSFTHRSEAVKTKARAAVADRRNQLLAAWFTCALSKRELEEPLVADALGKIYNKDALLEYLLAPPPSPETPVSSRPFGADDLLAAGHLRSLKDVQPLKLTSASSTGQQSIASATNADRGGQIEFGKARWECPITMRGMNGAIKFVYIKGCGCVASEVGLKELAGVRTSTPEEKENEGSAAEQKKAVCPVCAKELPGTKIEMVTLNPLGEEKEQMARAWADKVMLEEKDKAERKAAKAGKKKRKDAAAADDGELAAADKQSKKAKLSTAAALASSAHGHAAPSINRTLPGLPDAKKPVSKAVASLYAPTEGKEKLSALFSSGYSRR